MQLRAMPLVPGVRLRVRPAPIHVLLAIFAVLGLTYSFTTPVFEGPDEHHHYQYVMYLVNGHGFPIQSGDRSRNAIQVGHHPPLYYAIGALLTFWIDSRNPDLSTIYRPNPAWVLRWGYERNNALHTAAEQFPFRGASLALHVLRGLSVAFGVVTVWGTYRIGQMVTRNETIALGAAAVVALNPQYLFMSGLVNNDSAMTAFSTLALVIMVSLLAHGPSRSRAVWMGIWTGLAVLSKLNGLVLMPVIAAAISAMAIREHSWRTFIELAVWTGLPIIAISGWWFIQNQLVYGDLFGYKAFVSVFGLQPSTHLARVEAWIDAARFMHRSFWGLFGWLTIPLNPPLYDLLATVYLIAGVGALSQMMRRAKTGARPTVTFRGGWGLLLFVVFTALLWTFSYGLQVQAGWQGRFLFPAISAIAILIVSGVGAVVSDRWHWAPVGVVVVGLGLLAVSVPGQYIAPAYRFFTLPESALAVMPHRLGGTFSPEIMLAGYGINADDNTMKLTLYWHAEGTPPADYKVFIHVLGVADQLCGQRDALPQDGTFSMAYWRVGDVIQDEHVVPVDPACCSDGMCRLHVGLYREDTGERLLYSLDGQPISDHVEIVPD